jgi:hypothetical protein
VTGGWRKLRNEEPHNLFSYNYNDKVKEDEMGGECSTNGAKMNSYRILVRKPEGKRLPGRARRRWMDNIKTCIRETGWDGMDWIELAQNRGFHVCSRVIFEPPPITYRFL